MAGLYIHIPFCHSKCVYCDFYSSPARSEMEPVIDGLIREFAYRRNEITEPFDTIYIGGGTPSILPSSLFRRLSEALPVADAEEFTIEVNPEDVSETNVRVWRECGVNRVSMGIQSLDDSLLRQMGRRHTAQDALAAVETLCQGGITNISVDLIYGLPGLTAEAWRRDVKTVMNLPVTHLSAYCLTYHEGTMLYKMWQSGRVQPADDELVSVQFEILCDEADVHGFEHYEISNLARPGFRSRHNSGYWDPRRTWLGIGPSAHSFDGQVRRIDFMPTKRWMENLPAPFEIEEETPVELLNDTIVTGLRTLDGLDLESLPHPAQRAVLRSARRIGTNGQFMLDTGRLKIPRKHWLMSDYYIREVLLDEDDLLI